MQYIILCGTSNNNKFDKPRQLLEVNGERIVDRTIRLLKENGVSDIKISATDKAFYSCGVPIVRPTKIYDPTKHFQATTFWVDAFPLYDEPTTYLFGDVYFSENAINTITHTTTDDVIFFASRDIEDNEKNFKKWEEPFGFMVVNNKHFAESIEECKDAWRKGKTGRNPIAWELYRVLNGYDINLHIMAQNYVAIDDETTDIDEIDDVERLEHIIETVCRTIL